MKQILVAAILFSSSLFSFEWKDSKQFPLPINKNVVFYDKTNDEIWIGCPIEYRFYMLDYQDMFVEISHWGEIPSKPVLKEELCKPVETQNAKQQAKSPS